MAKNIQGLTDEAAEQDLFKIQKYIDGLTTFIETCNTPMTISIQGSWGTGKTSIMQIINNSLTEKRPQTTHNIWFNTWQFSQFNMDDDLAVSLLSCLLNELTASDEEKKKVQATLQALRFAGHKGKELFLSIIDGQLGGRTADNLDGFLQKFLSDQSDSVSTIKNLKNQFSQNVEDILKKNRKERVVIFIDDLDRLEPKRAVELLEVLKLFLDCKNCVFVLAIDYTVVCRGVEAKYGKLSENAKENAEKGRSFFDKIIQVPFKMPVAEYNINNYVKTCFEQIHISCPESEIDTYVDLIKSSIGANPRSMKRLFNAYLLLTIVVSDEVLNTDKNRQLLFGVLCLQQSFEKLYNFIVERRNILNYNLLEKLATAEFDSPEMIREALGETILSPEDISNAQLFMSKLLYQVIDIDQDNNISEQEINNLKNVLGISTMTSSSEDTAPTRISNVVETIQELSLTDVQSAETEKLLADIKSIGDDITFSMRVNKSSRHIIIKNGINKTIADIYFRKDGFAIDFYVSSNTRMPAEISKIVKKYAKLSKLENYLTIPVKFGDEESKNDFLAILAAYYKSHR